MIFGYMQVSLITALIILTMFLLIVIYTRFGLKKYLNWKWVFLYLIIFIISLSSSIFKYPEIWKKAVVELQLISLASIFSGIAAFLVISQISNKTAVYTKISNAKADEVETILLEPNKPSVIDFKIVNVSKITANDVVIQCIFPNTIKVESINLPVWSAVINNGHGFEVHLDTDKSYNPIHSNMTKSFKATIVAERIQGAETVIIKTIAKDINWSNHVFMLSTDKKFIENEKYINFIKKSKAPLYKIITNHFILLKSMIIIMGLISVSPYVYDTLNYLQTV